VQVLPQSLFGRLFAALIGVVIVTLLIIVVLILRERRELAFLGTGAWNTTRSIAETSGALAKLGGAERSATLATLRQRPLIVEELPRRRLASQPADLAGIERAFAAQLRNELGSGYDVAIRPAAPDAGDAIRVERGRSPALGPRPGPFARLFDVTVTLPDRERILFRTPAPLPGPPLPRQIFVNLGILTVVLGLVLFVMTRTITRPLRDLANAADAVGRGANHPPLPEKGARELRGATRAFNTMQDRLHRYLESRTRVLAAMSHDLRTTLTRLRLRAESIESDELRTRMAADLDEMAHMVHGALGLFRGLNDEEPLEPVDIDALLETLQREFAELGASVTVEGHAQRPFPAKPRALKRCLTNLLENAVKYGTRARVQVTDGEELAIRIRDEGPGIPAEALEQVFEPFFRIDPSRSRDTGGTGLGLSIARDIAQAHGGTVSLGNLPERGLEVVLTLPRAAPARDSD
jgi:signal transduction histidine kinase